MADAGREYPSEDVYSYDPDVSNVATESEEERFDSENIDNQANDLAAAFQRFKGQHVTEHGANLDDYLKRRRLRGYGNNAYNLEILGLECSGEIETSQQKYTRLFHEVTDLQEQIAIEQKSQDSDAKVESDALIQPEEVSALLSQLKCLQMEQIQGKPSNLNVTNANNALLLSLSSYIKSRKDKPPVKDAKTGQALPIDYKIYSPLSTAGDSIDATRCAKLEARLSALEKMLGSQEKLKSYDGDNLIEIVQSINEKLQLLDSAYLDGLDTRLVSVSTKLNDVIAKNEKAQNIESTHDDEFAKRIEALYNSLTKYDEIASSLPAICDRLLALQALHEQAAQVSQAITQVDGTNQQLVKQMTHMQEQLTAVEESMSHNVESVIGTLKNFDERFAKLK